MTYKTNKRRPIKTVCYTHVYEYVKKPIRLCLPRVFSLMPTCLGRPKPAVIRDQGSVRSDLGRQLSMETKFVYEEEDLERARGRKKRGQYPARLEGRKSDLSLSCCKANKRLYESWFSSYRQR